MNSPETFDPYGAENERPSTMKNRVTELAEKLTIEILPIAQPTPELARTNMMRVKGEKASPDGLREALSEVTTGVRDRELARAEAMRFPIDEHGLVEVAPKEFQVAHEVTKKLNQTLGMVRQTLETSVDPSLDGREIPANLIDSSEPYAFESEGATLDLLGVSQAELFDQPPDSVNVVRGGQITTTSMETPDGVIYSRESHIDANGQEIAFFGRILKPTKAA